jgi:uncharacterized membrane protein YfcA
MVVVSSVAMLSGVRYVREAPDRLSVAIGSAAGLLLGATGIGAPPVVLFLLSGPGSVRSTRAILTAFISTTSLIGVIALLGSGAMTMLLLLWSAGLAVVYLTAIWIGMRLFVHLSDRNVRTIALCLMLGLGITALVA